MAAQDHRQRHDAPRRRWRIAWLLGIGVLVNYFDRVNLSVSHDSLIAAFGISNIAFGYLSSAYNWTYAACQLPIGVLLDKFGVKRVGRIGISYGVWLLLARQSRRTWADCLAPGSCWAWARRRRFRPMPRPLDFGSQQHERSLATAMFDAAAKFSSAIGVPIIGIALLLAGWRWSFALTGVISVAYLLYFWRVYKDPDDDPDLSQA